MSLTEAVVALDVLLRTGVVRVDRLAQAAATLPPGRASARVRRAVELADGRSESPQESRLRMILVLGGLAGPEPQYEVRLGRRLLARVDLAYPEHRLAIEYDGRWHDGKGSFTKDRRRLKALAAAGWRVIPATAADLHHPGQLVASVRAALLAAA
ncbi:hypothetical protein BH20ACT5_BH20ACT5_06950 [soil metagenome]